MSQWKFDPTAFPADRDDWLEFSMGTPDHTSPEFVLVHKLRIERSKPTRGFEHLDG